GQPRRAEVRAHERGLLEAAEEEARVLLPERDEPDVRARGPRPAAPCDLERELGRERHPACAAVSTANGSLASSSRAYSSRPQYTSSTPSRRPQRARSIRLTFGSPGCCSTAHDLTPGSWPPRSRSSSTRRLQSRSAYPRKRKPVLVSRCRSAIGIRAPRSPEAR